MFTSHLEKKCLAMEVTCEVTASDADLEQIEQRFSWLRNGEPIENIDNSNSILLSSNLIQPEDVLSCKVTVEDSSGGSVEGQKLMLPFKIRLQLSIISLYLQIFPRHKIQFYVP